MLDRKNTISTSLVILVTLMLRASIQPAKAQFVIAWTYDNPTQTGFDYDAYGQGLYGFTIWENVTNAPYWTNVGAIWYFNESTTIEWEVGYGVRIYIFAWMNSTLTGSASLADGVDDQRMNITVTRGTTEVDNQDDITCFYYTSVFDAEMWYYGFEVVLDILPVAGATYTIGITYEVYW